MTPAPPITPLKFELRYHPAAYKVTPKKTLPSQEPAKPVIDRYEFVRNEDRDAMIPATPPLWEPLTGSHAEVTARADEMNALQWSKGYMYFFFYPELAGSSQTYNPEHCDACARQANLNAA